MPRFNSLLGMGEMNIKTGFIKALTRAKSGSIDDDGRCMNEYYLWYLLFLIDFWLFTHFKIGENNYWNNVDKDDQWHADENNCFVVIAQTHCFFMWIKISQCDGVVVVAIRTKDNIWVECRINSSTTFGVGINDICRIVQLEMIKIGPSDICPDECVRC